LRGFVADRGWEGALSGSGAVVGGSPGLVGPVEAIVAARGVPFGHAKAGGPAPIVVVSLLVCQVSAGTVRRR
jgi:hypothetical protein